MQATGAFVLDIATNCKLPVQDSKAIVYYDNSQGAVPYEFTITVPQGEYQKLQGVTDMKILACDDAQISLFETHVDKQQQNLLQQFGQDLAMDQQDEAAPMIESYEIGSTPITNFFPFQSGYYQVKLRKRTKFPKEVKAGNGSKKRTCSLILAFFVQAMPVFFLVVKRNIIIFSRQREANNYVTNTNVNSIPVAYTPQQYVHFLVDRLKICEVEETKKPSKPKGITKGAHQLHHHQNLAHGSSIAASLSGGNANGLTEAAVFNNFKPRVISSSVFQYATVLPNGDVLLQASPPTSSPSSAGSSQMSPMQQQQLTNLSPIQLQLGPNSPIQLVFTNATNGGSSAAQTGVSNLSPMQQSSLHQNQQFSQNSSVYYEPLFDFVPQLNVRYASTAQLANQQVANQQQFNSLVQQAQIHQFPSSNPQSASAPSYSQQQQPQAQAMPNYLPQASSFNAVSAPPPVMLQQQQQQPQAAAFAPMQQQASYMSQQSPQHIMPQQQQLLLQQQASTMPIMLQQQQPMAQMQPSQMQPHQVNLGGATRMVKGQIPAPVVARSVSEVGSGKRVWGSPEEQLPPVATSEPAVVNVQTVESPDMLMRELEEFLQYTVNKDSVVSFPGVQCATEEQELYSLFNSHLGDLEKNGVHIIADNDLIEIAVENSCVANSSAQQAEPVVQQLVAIGGFIDYSTIVFLPKEQAQTIVSERKRLLFGGLSSSLSADQQHLLQNPEQLTCKVLEPGKSSTVQVQINTQHVFSHDKLKKLVKQQLPGHEDDFKQSGITLVTSIVFVKGAKKPLLNSVHRKRYAIIHDYDPYNDSDSDSDNDTYSNDEQEVAEITNRKEDEEIAKSFAQQVSI